MRSMVEGCDLRRLEPCNRSLSVQPRFGRPAVPNAGQRVALENHRSQVTEMSHTA